MGNKNATAEMKVEEIPDEVFDEINKAIVETF